jgi:hypothetical protein
VVVVTLATPAGGVAALVAVVGRARGRRTGVVTVTPPGVEPVVVEVVDLAAVGAAVEVVEAPVMPNGSGPGAAPT